MEKLKMHSPNLAEENIKRLAELFPNCVVESVGAIHELPLHETPNVKI